MKIGIDASNIRSGGGVTHLVHLLNAADPRRDQFTFVIIWAGPETQAKIPAKPWLIKKSPAAIAGSGFSRAWWQRFGLSREVRENRCDVLFVPGGAYVGSFRPIVTMSRNLLPFEWRELLRFGVSTMTVKLAILRHIQARSFRLADGVIFLTEYARDVVKATTPVVRDTVIPHGVERRFIAEKKRLEFEDGAPIRLLYVSNIEVYKHHWNVVDAVAELRKEGLSVTLDVVGSASPRPLRRFMRRARVVDPSGTIVRWRGAASHSEIERHYHEADIFVFASSCENMPNILIESMAAGLPIACSERGPMPEVLGAAGEYFDPEHPGSIAAAIRRLIADPERRRLCSEGASARAREYSWERTAAETFQFIRSTAEACRPAPEGG